MLPKIIIGLTLITASSFLFLYFSHTTFATDNTAGFFVSPSNQSGLTYTHVSKSIKTSTKIRFTSPTPVLTLSKDAKITEPAEPTEPTEPTPDNTPTPTPTSTRRMIRKITSSPTPTKAVTNPELTPTPTSQTSGDAVKDHIMNAINDYRRSNGLSSVKTDPHTCSFAKTRAKEITGNFNHDGFRNRIDSNSLPYPTYSSVTENIAETSDYTQVVPMWIASPGHAENMRKDTPFVCVEREGDYYAYLGWKP